MRTMKIFLIIAIATVMVLTVALTIATNKGKEEDASVKTYSSENHSLSAKKFTPVKRVSRFLAEDHNPRAPDLCLKDNDVCSVDGRQEATCCSRKCVDLKSDFRNCGACNKKCEFTQTCCNGECVDMSFDERHSGHCNNKCKTGGYCLHGMCDYT